MVGCQVAFPLASDVRTYPLCCVPSSILIALDEIEYIESALPAPVWYTLTKSSEEEPVAIISGAATEVESAVKVVPSNLSLLSTVPFGAVPFSVIIPLSVVPVRSNSPLVPEVPDVPLVPDVPSTPLVPFITPTDVIT